MPVKSSDTDELLVHAKALLTDVRPHLTEAIALFKRKYVYDRAAAVHVRLARFLGQLNGASSSSEGGGTWSTIFWNSGSSVPERRLGSALA